MQPRNQKIKLAKMIEILRYETSEEEPICTQDFIKRLNDYGITSERRSIYKDIKELQNQGYEVKSRQVSKQLGYYMEDNSFTLPEMKILMDAVQAAAFITEDKTRELVEKIADLGGPHKARLLKENIVCFNTRKHSNEEIYTTVASLEEAIRKKRRASFCYYDLNEHLEKVLRKDGERYQTEPLALIYNEDNYYLLAYSEKYENTTTYRIDRMTDVRMEKEKISDEGKQILRRRSAAKHTEEVFKMYAGEKERITLEFDESLIGPVVDKFGEKIRMRRTRDGKIRTTVDIQRSPVFEGWMAQFGKKMIIKDRCH